MTPEEELTQFLIDHGERESKAPLTVEAWFYLISFNIKQSETENAVHGFTKQETFDLFLDGMVNQLSWELDCTPNELAEELRKTLTEYLEQPDKEGNSLPAETVDHLFAVFPKTSRLPNNDFSRRLTNGIINNGKQTFIFDKTHDVSAEIETTQPATVNGLKVNGRYNYFDAEISRGIDDIYMENGGSCFFSLQNLYHVINHDPYAKASDNELQAMTESIETQRITKATGNIEKILAYAESHGADVSEFPPNIDDMLLDVRGGPDKESGGKIVPSYFIKERPLPALFGELLGQELKIPSKCYCIRKVDSKGGLGETLYENPARIAIRGYLMERIFAMKNDYSFAKKKRDDAKAYKKHHPKSKVYSLSHYRSLKSNTILFDSVFDAAGLQDVPRNTLNRHKKYILQCLDYLCAINEIAGYTKSGKRKNSVDQVEIILEK